MRSQRRRSLRESGMTLLELMIVMAIIAIIANIIIPGVLYQLDKARAMRIVNDFYLVRQAAMEYRIDNGDYPADIGRGRVPSGLDRYLPKGLDWRDNRDPYTYDWDNWVRPDGRSRRPATGIRVGFTVISPDRRRHTFLQKVYDGAIVIRGARVTFLIESAQ